MDFALIIISILVILNILSFICGYILAKVTSNSGVYNSQQTGSINKTIKNQPLNRVIIDDTKYVTDIKTDNLEKKYDQLGDTKQSSDNIDSAINKLKNMKG